MSSGDKAFVIFVLALLGLVAGPVGFIAACVAAAVIAMCKESKP